MVAVGGAIWLGRWYFADAVVPWTAAELRSITTLWIGNLPPLGPSPTNAMADDPLAAKLGHQLFFDARLSGNGKVSCSTCHQPARLFADGLRVSVGVRTTERNAMSVVGAAYSPWLFWDGRKDSLWSQALAPLESAVEHGGSRMQYAHLIQDDRTYRARYEELFGAMPDFSDRDRFPERAGPVDDAAARAAWEHMAEGDRQAVTQVFVNLGKTLEAYQRQLRPGAARFDSYVDALLAEDSAAETARAAVLTDSEVAGLKLFIGDAQCINCHNGPLLTNNDFHNTAVLTAPGMLPAKGRITAVKQVAEDPFNCLGPYSDDPARVCAELRFMKTGDELIGAHRTPSLRNVAETAPYMHAGQQATLADVLDQYNRAPAAIVGHNEAKPLGLSSRQLRDLEAFLRSLSGPVSADARWLEPPLPITPEL
jgi:cytochrome c peroxidase